MKMRNESKKFTAERAETGEIKNSDFEAQVNDSNANVQNGFISIWDPSE